MRAEILIIEDDESIRRNLVVLFSSLEYEVSSAASAEAALEIIKHRRPDVIICDINLPKMSGFELKEILNGQKETFNVPLIFLTARNTYEDLREGMSLAADDYIFKPYKAEDVIKSVELRLTKSKSSFSKEKSDAVFVKVNSTVRKILVKNINVILAENQYSRICQINGKEYLIRRSLSEWQKLLDENFYRISRSAIVNLDLIEKIENITHGKYVYLDGFEGKVKATHLGFLEKLK